MAGAIDEAMICLRCDNEEFTPKQKATLEQEFKDETLEVKSPAMECTKCGWVTISNNQLDALRRNTADAYRRQHNLLTSGEIQTLRKRIGQSQSQFATFLGVGVASLKRWETWGVQDKSHDQLMRLKTREAIAVKNRIFRHPNPLRESAYGIVNVQIVRGRRVKRSVIQRASSEFESKQPCWNTGRSMMSSLPAPRTERNYGTAFFFGS